MLASNRIFRRDWPTAIALAASLVHLAVANRYGFFRDELYFIDCGRSPAFGYVDQPPLIPLIAALTQVFGRCLVLIRAIPAIAHGLTTLFAARLAGLIVETEEIDAPFAPVLAAISVAAAPMYFGLHATLNTTSIEPFAWTLLAYLVTRRILLGEARALVLAGVVAGLSLEMKYAIPFYLAPLVLGIAIGPDRRILISRSGIIGALIAVAIAAPSAIWQVVHGLPFLELMAAAKDKNIEIGPLAFVLNQLLVFNPLAAPFWLAGFWTLFDRRFVRIRFLAIGFFGVLVEMIVLHGKEYYPAPAYASMFSVGAIAIEPLLRRRAVRIVWVALAVANSILIAPVAMTILDPPVLAAYLAVLPIGPSPQEKTSKNAELPQLQADQLGWPELESKVAEVWRTLTPEERAHAAILASNYGEAGAIDFYGREDGLPHAIGGHNQLFLWGPRGHDGSVVVVVNGSLERWQPRCEAVTVAATFGVPYAMPYEQDRPILVCKRTRRPLEALWSELKVYR